MPAFLSAARASLRAALSAPLRFVTKRQKELRSAWRREANRILRNVERAEARGYVFDYRKLNLNPPTVYQQRSVERLRKIRGDALYDYALKVDMETGEFVTGREGRRIERSEAARRGARTRAERGTGVARAKGVEPRTPQVSEEPQAPGTASSGPKAAQPSGRIPGWPQVVIDNFRDQILESPKPAIREKLLETLDRWVEMAGEEGAAEIIQELMDSGDFDFMVIYDTERANGFIDRWSNRMYERGYIDLEQRESLVSTVEEDYYWRDWDNGEGGAY